LRWCAYAWPETRDGGSRTLFIDVDRTIHFTTDSRYSGDDGPEPGAAYVSGGPTNISGVTASGVRGQDGNVWTAMQ